jgi:hypothetical protein
VDARLAGVGQLQQHLAGAGHVAGLGLAGQHGAGGRRAEGEQRGAGAGVGELGAGLLEARPGGFALGAAGLLGGQLGAGGAGRGDGVGLVAAASSALDWA